MPIVALVLLLVAAISHASWNLLVKHAAASRHFNWFYSTGTVVLYAPLALCIGYRAWPFVTPVVMLCLVATGILHIGYSEALQRGYRAADLSVVYPVARGTAPFIAFIGAVVLLRETPSWLALLGLVFVIAGVFLIAGGPRILNAALARRGLAWGAMTAVLIAAYTLVDGYSVKVLFVSPILVDYAGNTFRAIALAPKALRDRDALFSDYRQHWLPALGVSILGPFAYILVLFAMTLAPISHIAPAREISMVIGAYFGSRLFNEGARRTRTLAAAMILTGVMCLTLS
jgi:drug/metabolite transporter (DMT)-like permease